MPILPIRSWRFFAIIISLSLAACGGRPTVTSPEESTANSGGKGGRSGTSNLGGARNTTTIDIHADVTGGTTTCTGDGCNAAAGAGSTPSCGNGRLDAAESCDDGNATPGDGCDGLCRIEFGSECRVPGQPCTSALYCGDGKAGPDEACDDGNTSDGDGCSKGCAVELGFACNVFGVPCVRAANDPICGNMSLEAGESCDDGDQSAGDGCSATCQLEAGWLCPKPGQNCVKNEFCGDGILNGIEQCDDGNLKAGDCCTGTCRLESNCVCATPVTALVPPHQVCMSTVICGDAKVTGNEMCDDGNTQNGDGCAADCGAVEPGYGCPPAGGACSKTVDPCGNARIDAAEECDDGQSPALGGDGCSATCKVEPGFVCPTPGTACRTIEFCGDGKVNFSLGETCDDGNKTDLDGCSSLCHVEPGFRCTGAPSQCTNTVVCGDKKILGTEICDDGNTASSDGCSSSCQLEDGYQCPIVGIACQPICGDGKLHGLEQCDDNNRVDSDGCSSRCTLEIPSDTERDGWQCPTPGAACVRTTCGNGIVEGSEQCDDGDNDMGDGCTPFCRREPSCPTAGGACSTACGDGILLPIDKTNGQECDDGNTVSGDGCSATCKIESGFSCADEVVSKTLLILPIILRDFKAYNEANGHPDFENYNNNFERGIVQNGLDADGKPQHVTVNKNNTENAYTNNVLTSTVDYFSKWYRDDANYNKTILQTLSFTRLTTGEYEYANTSFFPLTGLGWGNYGTTGRNFHFTSEVRYWFEYAGGETLKFRGDDDVWVFVNKQLAVDLGGVHSAINGSVVLHASNGSGTVCENATVGCGSPKTVTLGLELGKVYEIVVFQAERHTSASNYTLTLGSFAATRSNCAPICGDGIITATEQCDLGPGKNVGGYGGCVAPDCVLGPFCGDSHIDSTDGEQCDDGINATPYGTAASGCAPGCVPNHYCGDLSVDTDFGEACDLGSQNSATAYGPSQCLGTCQPAPFCGDGFKNGPEQCDLGGSNGAPTSNCDTQCKFKCGNGTVDAGEQCDNGSAGNDNSYGGCRSNCTLAPYCGDGFKNGAELCDDGKNDGSYGTCKPNCTLADYCGDGVPNLDAGEKCDRGAGNVADQYGPSLCTTRCLPAPFCGDNAVDSQYGEHCDDGANNSDSLAGACKTDCSGYNTPPLTCGNARVDAGEECDDGSALNGTATSTCDVRCQYKCGNGIKDSGEQCDDGRNDGTYGTCKPDCSLSDYCGDGTKNGPEQCDLGLGNELAPYGLGKCTKQCSLAPYCGDDRVQSPNEECDGQSGCTSTCHWGTILQ